MLRTGTKFDVRRFEDDAKRFQLMSSQVLANATHAQNKSDIGLPIVSSAKKRKKKKKNVKKENEMLDDLDDTDDEDLDEDAGDVKRSVLGDDSDDEIALTTHITNRRKLRVKKKLTISKLAEMKKEQLNHVRNQNHIHVTGEDIPDPLETFAQLVADYKLREDILNNIMNMGYTTPTPIQMQAIPVMIHRRETLACAPTGSGKTAAFLIPLLHHLKGPKRMGFRALIVEPTRELAKQVYGECCRLSEGVGFRIHLIDKVKSAKMKFGSKSARRFDILITTPNRLIYLLQQDPPVINLENVEWLVIDECDKLFEAGAQGFRDQLAVIYRACSSPNIRRAMFSATYAYDVEEWCKLNLDNVIAVFVGVRNSAVDTVMQELIFVGNESGKLIAFRDLVKAGLSPPVLVFVQTKERAKELFNELIYDGINVEVIHADRTQLQRDNVVKAFRTGKIWVLICTELMGRGIDFKGVSLVVNYDFPSSAISYIHRIGRTGRAGRPGRAITYFTEDDIAMLRSIATVIKNAGCPVPEYMLKLKKQTKEEKRQLAKSAPPREQISTIPLYDIERAEKERYKTARRRFRSKSRSQSEL